MSLIIMPSKKVAQIMFLDQEVIGGDAVEFSKAVNQAILDGWTLDGKTFARGIYLVQPMSRVIEQEVTNAD